MFTRNTVFADPISWFRAGLIANPSAFVLSLPGRGKSTLVGRMVTGLSAMDVMPIVSGDLRPDYVDLVKALGGQVIRLGLGVGALNVLDPGEAVAAAHRLSGDARDEVMAEAHGRRLTIVKALITIMRGAPLGAREHTVLDQALRILDDRHHGVPVLADLLKVVQDAPQELRAVALDRNKLPRYQRLTEELEASLIGLLTSHYGQVFARPTAQPMRLDRPVVFDMSGVADTDEGLQAAALLAGWSTAFGAVNIGQVLADAGLEPRRHHLVVMDELWRALRFPGMVEYVDRLSRLNRSVGVGQVSIMHTLKDLESLTSDADRKKALGLVERAGMVFCGALPRSEMDALTQVVPMSTREQRLLSSWASPVTWTRGAHHKAVPPGRGKFLIKIGERSGIPFEVLMTPAELGAMNSNRRWD